jgi:hypothetical protein
MSAQLSDVTNSSATADVKSPIPGLLDDGLPPSRLPARQKRPRLAVVLILLAMSWPHWL